MKEGKAIIVSAPSGAGKTTLVHHLLSLPLNLAFSVSACSRKKRDNEQEGKDYYFLSVSEFRKKIDEEAFVEWEEVYKDHFYGTLKSETDRIWQQEKHVIFDVDVVGGLNLKKAFGDRALSIFVQPPSVDVLEQRLRQRSSESEEMLAQRVQKSWQELEHAPNFDVVILNDQLDQARNEIEKVVSKFLTS